LAAGCVVVVLYFEESAKMEAAYGLAITLTMISTSILLLFYLRMVKNVSWLWISLFALVYATIEISFLIANLDKFPHGGWFSLVAGSIFGIIMLAWYRSKNIQQKLKEFTRFSPYVHELQQLSQDTSIPKYVTHLVYMTSSDKERFVEEKIIHSIFGNKPKRADIYWFLHVNITDEPYTMEYKADIIASDDVIWIHLNLGFRVELRVDYFFKQVLGDLIKNKEVNLGDSDHYQKLIGNKGLGDFTFIILESFLSNASELSWTDDLLMSLYFFVKGISSNAEDWFGLDPSSVVIEKAPLVISPTKPMPLQRVFELEND